MEKIVVFLALHKMITQNITLFDRNNDESNLIFSNGKYILIPFHKKNKLVTYNTLKSKRNNRVNRLNLSNKRVIDFISHQKNNRLLTSKNSVKVNTLGIPTPKPKKKFTKVSSITATNNNSDTISSKMLRTVNEIMKKIITIEKLNNFIQKIKADKRQSIVLEKLEEMNEKIFEYGNIIDYLKPNSKEILIKYLIKKNNKNSLNPTETLLFDNCYNILYTKTHVYYKDPSFNGKNELFGYKIIENGRLIYYKFQGNTFIKATIEESKAIEKSTLKKVDENNETRPAAVLCGYLEHKMPANEILFKIRDKQSEGKKGTQIKTGSVCNNDGMRKNKVVTYIQRINEELAKAESFSKNNNYKDTDKKLVPGKEFLCYELELYFRYLDIITNNRYFYNSEETLEYKLNEK